MKPLSIITCLLAFVLIAAVPPTIKFKDGIVTRDGSPYFKATWEKLLDAHELKTTKDEMFLLLINRQYEDNSQVSQGKSSTVHYVEARVPGKDSIMFEMDAFPTHKFKMSHLAQLFVKYNVINDNGDIIQANLNRMSNDLGKPHSRRRNELGN